MQTRKLSLVIATAAFGMTLMAGSASAANKFNVTFDRPAIVAGVELKPGEYKLTVEGNKVTIASGKEEAAQAEVTVQTEQRKFSSTAVRYDMAEGKANVTQIKLGGTNQVLDFSNATATSVRGGGAVRNTAK